MAEDQRIQEFQQAVEHKEGPHGRPGKSFGLSNAARYLEGAFLLGRPNLESNIVNKCHLVWDVCSHCNVDGSRNTFGRDCERRFSGSP